MKPGYRFDATARTERYFVATLLTHLLISNNFTGLKQLFQQIFDSESCTSLSDDFEIVSELDPLRDGSVQSSIVKKLYQEHKRIAVPDLFLRWGHNCVVIEAKFFTDPAAEELHEQVKLQKEAIKKVQPYTFYNNWEIRYAILTVEAVTKIPIPGIISLTWDQIVAIFNDNDNLSVDMIYAINTIKSAIKRFRQTETSNVSYERLKYVDLINQLPRLINQGKVFIGFTGGLEAFESTTLSEIQHRSHYRVSDVQWTDNWFSLDQFLHHIFSLQGYIKTYNDHGE